ncbi:hypothetical protein GCM10020370_16030 [Paenibacillus hodogayensis]
MQAHRGAGASVSDNCRQGIDYSAASAIIKSNIITYCVIGYEEDEVMRALMYQRAYGCAET